MKLLCKDVNEATYCLTNALREAGNALENLEEFWIDDKTSSQQFDWLIEQGFIPGKKFILTVPGVGNREWTVKSYAYHLGRPTGASVKFEYKKEGKPIKTYIGYHTISAKIELFEKVG